MPPRNQRLLCACLVLAAALGWILHHPPQTSGTVAWSGAAADGEADEEPPSPAAAVVIPINNITEPPAAQDAPPQSPAPLPADFLRRILSGDEKTVTIPLPDGGSVGGVVSLIRRDEANALLLVQGTVTQPEAGRFMFQRQTLPGKAGAMVGYIYYDHNDIAWQVRPLGENGAPVLVKTTVDEVICRAYAAPAGVEEIPATHPTDHPIPPDENGVIQLQSLPGAEAVIYLDFDGETRNFDSWGIINAASSGASTAQIFEVWKGVCEDFQPFGINITTVRAVYDAAQPGRRMQVIVTPTDDAYPGAGGAAITGSFNWTGDMVCWSFSTTGKNAVEVIAHETGHTLGLSHDGRNAPYTEYYQGHNGWAPIMGVGYFQPLTQWSMGEYPSANNLQDDLQIITTNNNAVGYRADDHAASSTASPWLDIASGGAVSSEGIIETRSDRDSFRFSTTGGVISLQINPVAFGNLDVEAEILSVTSTLITTIATSDPASSLAATFNGLYLSAGDYLLRVSGTGKGSLITGYSDYASLGSYTITGTISGGVHADRFTIAENPATGSAVGTVISRADHDGGTLAFAIDSSDAAGAFVINPATGAITVADESLLDFEALSTRWDDPAVIELFVAITDNLDFTTEIVRVAISLTNVNEAPDFPTPAGVVIPDTLPLGMTVATVTATDPDQSDYVSYSITAGNGGGHFSIDSATGEITLAAPLDYQALPVHQLTLRATDHLSPANVVEVPLIISLVDVSGNLVTGTVVRTFYSGIEGGDVADLTTSPFFPDKPNTEAVLTSFDSGLNQGASYGSTVRGYLVAPATGEYTFWISADDSGELLISPDTNPANAAPCASIGSPAAPGNWTSQPSQQSAAIELTAGEVYYIEARHKQWTGGDHIQVAWQGPGMTGPEIIPGRWLAPFHQQHAPWAPDLTASVREAAAEGTFVCRVSYSFIEPNIGEEITSYAISSGNEDGSFTMDPLNGEIRVAAGAALVAGNPRVLTVSATDDGNPAAIGYATVNITVTGLDVNLHAWWRLDETAGVSLADSSGNNRQALLAGSGSWVARSPSNPVLRLDGVSSYYAYHDFESLYGTQPFTVAAWVKVPVTHASNGVLIQQLNLSGEFGPGRYDVVITSDGHVRFSVFGRDQQNWNGMGSQFEITSPQAIHDGEWHHVACVRDGENGRIFIDGIESAVGSGAIRMLDFESSTVVGYNASNGSAFLDADVDDVRIYAEALVGPQIIKVASIPIFSTDPIIGGDATQDAPYSGTIATSASDPDAGDTLAFSKTAGPEWLIVAADGMLSGTPENDDVGPNNFTVRVTDLAGAFVQTQLDIAVVNVNDPPEFSVNPIIGGDATQDASYSGTIAASASDPDAGDMLAFSKANGPEWLIVAADGMLSGTPENDDVGPNNFTVRVTDLAGAFVETQLDIAVVNVNDPPEFSVNPIIGGDATQDAPYSGTLAASASDPDAGDTLAFSKTAGPEWLIVAADGTLSGTPENDDVGPNNFTVRVTDLAGAFVQTQLDIAVVNVNDPPEFSVNPIIGGDATQDASYSGTIAASASDPDAGDTLAFSKINGPEWLIVAADGMLSGTPENDDVGPNNFTVRVTDLAGAFVETQLDIAVVNLNDAPEFSVNPIIGGDATQDAPYSGMIAASASDPDAGDTLAFSKIDGPEWLIVAADGMLSGTPENDDVGPNNFTVRVTDLVGAFVETQLDIAVLNVNDPPEFSANPIIISNGTALAGYSGTLVGTANDPDTDDTLVFAKTDGPEWLSVAEDGALSGTPAGSDAGINLFIVSVTDSLGAVTSTTLQITVHPPPMVSVDASDPTAAETGPQNGVFTITRSGSTAGDLTINLTLKGTALNGTDYAEIPNSVVIPGGAESVNITIVPTSDELIEGTETVTLSLAEGPYEPGEFISAFIAIRDSNHAPFFLADPVLAPAALVGESYTGESLADHADDPNLDDGDSLSFEKTGGPAWLLIAPDGSLSGTPDELDSGINLFPVRVTDAEGLTADGTLQINVTVPSPFESWQLAEFGPQAGDPMVAGELADPDQDNLSNLLEYAFGTDPNQPDAAHTELDMVNIEGTDYMRLTYFVNPAAAEISLIVEGTDDFTNPAAWSDQNIIVEEVTTARIVVRDTVGGTRRFFRIRVTH